MCYDIKTSLEKQLRRAILDGNLQEINEINEKLSIFTPEQIELNHASGFTHPKLIIYTEEDLYTPIIATWGLVPYWVRDSQQKNQLWNKTLNARAETMFDKPSFRQAARSGKCLIHIEGFYEHRHINKKTYPYYITSKNEELLTVAGLYSKWYNPDLGEEIITFSIVTTKANNLMTKIHNNPKLKEPRMPLILPTELENKWLLNAENPIDQKLLNDLVLPFVEEELKAFTVAPIKGKNSTGNTISATKPKEYAEVVAEDNKTTLF